MYLEIQAFTCVTLIMNNVDSGGCEIGSTDGLSSDEADLLLSLLRKIAFASACFVPNKPSSCFRFEAEEQLFSWLLRHKPEDLIPLTSAIS